ncbi:MAG TPA: hypothetical protein VG324_17400 [Blastocatellia bacterium]|nr:hypothetical protein [Blastocatellia bacterium]
MAVLSEHPTVKWFQERSDAATVQAAPLSLDSKWLRLDEGATIITHEINKPFYERTLRAPRTINPDRLAREKRALRLSPVGAKRVMMEETRTIELHHLKDSPHDKGLIVVYLPKEKMLIEVDAYTPLAVDDPPPAVPPPPAVNLYENIERLKLDVDRIAPLHGRIVRLEDLKKTIGK